MKPTRLFTNIEIFILLILSINGNSNNQVRVDEIFNNSYRMDTVKFHESKNGSSNSLNILSKEKFQLYNLIDSNSNYLIVGYFSEKPNVSKIIYFLRLGNHWVGECYSISTIDSILYKNLLNDNQFQKFNCTPKNGWNKLYFQINDLGIFNLPNQKDLKNVYLSTGGDCIKIVYRNKGKKGELTYFDILPLSYKYSQVKRIKKLVVLLENEFGIDLADNY